MNISNRRHVKSFDQYIEENYNPILNSDPDPGIKIDPDHIEEIDNIENGGDESEAPGKDLEEDALDREFDEPSQCYSHGILGYPPTAVFSPIHRGARVADRRIPSVKGIGEHLHHEHLSRAVMMLHGRNRRRMKMSMELYRALSMFSQLNVQISFLMSS
ncbi:MAG: hypothetical protein ABIQ57_17795 [Candidatus Kapaibacterium sp.]